MQVGWFKLHHLVSSVATLARIAIPPSLDP
jgi:hypothetical protein